MSWEVSGSARIGLKATQISLWACALVLLVMVPIGIALNIAYDAAYIQKYATDYVLMFVLAIFTATLLFTQGLFYHWSLRVNEDEIRIAQRRFLFVPKKVILYKDQLEKVIVEKKGYAELMKSISPSYHVKITFVDKNGREFVPARPLLRRRWFYFTQGFFNGEADLEKLLKEFEDVGIKIERTFSII